MSDIQKKWFAARVRDKQEFLVRSWIEKLRTANVLDVEYYLPTRIVVRQLKYRRKKVEIPLIKNLIFTGNMLVVPDKQMDDFRFVLDLSPDGVSFDNSALVVGSKVKVVKGEFAGIEGKVGIEANKTYVIIHIQGALTANIKIPKSYLKPIE